MKRNKTYLVECQAIKQVHSNAIQKVSNYVPKGIKSGANMYPFTMRFVSF